MIHAPSVRIRCEDTLLALMDAAGALPALPGVEVVTDDSARSGPPMAGSQEMVHARSGGVRPRLPQVIASLRELHAEAEHITSLRRAELAVAREALAIAEHTERKLSTALEALEPGPRKPGRPRGGDPSGVNERIRALLPTRREWTGVEMREALSLEGINVEANRVSAAFARLASGGVAYRIEKGKWRALQRLAPRNASTEVPSIFRAEAQER